MGGISELFGRNGGIELNSPQQGFLNQHMYGLADLHRRVLNRPTVTVPVHLCGGVENKRGEAYRNVKLIDGGTHPATFLQKLMSFTGIYDFLNIEPWMQALLVPKIRIYREFEYRTVGGAGAGSNFAKHEIRFAEHWGALSDKTSHPDFDFNMAKLSDAAVGEVGIVDFTFDDIGRHPGVGGRVFETKLKLYAKSLQALARHQGNCMLPKGRDSSEFIKIPVRATDLLVPCSHVTEAYNSDGSSLTAGFPFFAKTKIRIGWELNPKHQVELEMGRGTSYLNTALAVMQQEFDLFFSKYDISFNEDGAVNITIDFAANVIEQDVNNLTDMLSGDSGNNWQTRLTQNTSRERSASIAEEMAGINEINGLLDKIAAMPDSIVTLLGSAGNSQISSPSGMFGDIRDAIEALGPSATVNVAGTNMSVRDWVISLNNDASIVLAVMFQCMAMGTQNDAQTGASNAAPEELLSWFWTRAWGRYKVLNVSSDGSSTTTSRNNQSNARSFYSNGEIAYAAATGADATDANRAYKAMIDRIVTSGILDGERDALEETQEALMLSERGRTSGGNVYENVARWEINCGLGMAFTTLMNIFGHVVISPTFTDGPNTQRHYTMYGYTSPLSSLAVTLRRMVEHIEEESEGAIMDFSDEEAQTVYNWIIADLTIRGKMYYSAVNLVDFYRNREYTTQEVIDSLNTVNIVESEEDTFLANLSDNDNDLEWSEVEEANRQYTLHHEDAEDFVERSQPYEDYTYTTDEEGQTTIMSGTTYDNWYAFADANNIEYRVSHGGTTDEDYADWGKRIYFVYLGDIIESAYMQLGGTTQLVLGGFYYDDAAGPINLADIPISLHLFTDVWRDLQEQYRNRPLTIQAFIGTMMREVNNNIYSMKNVHGEEMPGISFGVDSYIDRRTITVPHAADESFDDWWPRYGSRGPFIRLNAASSQFQLPIPFTSDDLDFSSLIYIYGTSAKPPLALSGDADADMLRSGWRESPNGEETATGVDSYYENFGPIYHLTYGADRGIVKKLNFGTISNANLATYFVMQDYNNENAPDGAYDYRSSENSATVAAEEAQAEREANQEEPEEKHYDDEGYLLEEENGDRVQPLQTRAQVERQQEIADYVSSAQEMSLVQLIHKVDITLAGTSLFKNGTYVYVDPTLPGVATSYDNITAQSSTSDGVHISPEIATKLGIGGYYLITKVSGKIGNGTYEVEVEGMLEVSQQTIQANIRAHQGD